MYEFRDTMSIMENILDNAIEFAAKAHEGQKYGSGPYTDHLETVYRILLSWGFTKEFSPVLLAASYLHDVLEDTDTSYEQLRDLFGRDVALRVKLVTDPEAPTRAERKLLLYRQFEQAVNVDLLLASRAAYIKFADRIANQARSIADHDYRRMDMYLKEFPEFFIVFSEPIRHDPIFKEFILGPIFKQYRDLVK